MNFKLKNFMPIRTDIKLIYFSMNRPEKWRLKRDMYSAKERKYKVDLMWEYLNNCCDEKRFIEIISKWQKP